MNDRFDFASAQDVERVEAKLDRLMSMLANVDVKPKPEWLRLKDAAKHYGCSVDTIRRRIDSGALQARGSGKLREVKVG